MLASFEGQRFDVVYIYVLSFWMVGSHFVKTKLLPRRTVFQTALFGFKNSGYNIKRLLENLTFVTSLKTKNVLITYFYGYVAWHNVR